MTGPGRTEKRPRRPTLADVAALAGTSTAVVSYVVNEGPRAVSEATRARVQKAIAATGYRRNALAGALSAGRSDLVGLLVPDSSNAFFSELSHAIESEGRRRGLLTLLGNTAYDREVEGDYATAFSDLRVRGIFVTSIGVTDPPPAYGRLIYVHSRPARSRAPSVVFDDVGGGVAATEHLLAHGYADVRCVTGPDDFGPSGQRERGWRLAMDRAGLRAAGRLHRVPYSRVEAESSARAILAGRPRPRAVFATTDEQALAILRAASVLGLRVPEELAIVGFDGISEALHGSVRLTTVSLPIAELAARAFDTLDAEDEADTSHVLSGSLVIGETCGCRPTVS